MPKYELSYLKEIKPDSTRIITRLTRTEKWKEPEYLNAKLETHSGYSDEKTVNVGHGVTIILARGDLDPEVNKSFAADLENLHSMIINLIASAESTLMLKNQFEVKASADLTSAILREYIWASKRSRPEVEFPIIEGFNKDTFKTIKLSPEQEQTIESIFSYAKEQRFLPFTRHKEEEQLVIKQDGSDASRLKM